MIITDWLIKCSSSDLLADLIESLWAVSIAELHVHGVVEEGKTSLWLQYSVYFFEETWMVKPVKRRHARHKVHLAIFQRKLFSRAFSVYMEEREATDKPLICWIWIMMNMVLMIMMNMVLMSCEMNKITMAIQKTIYNNLHSREKLKTIYVDELLSSITCIFLQYRIQWCMQTDFQCASGGHSATYFKCHCHTHSLWLMFVLNYTCSVSL